MSSPQQIEANRLNSQKSTGPRSVEGKAVSRFNALKSGIHAQSQVIPGEDPVELEALADEYHQQFQPATPLDCFLVDALIHADWQLRRLHRLEAQLWTSQIHEITGDAPLGEAYSRALDTFTRLQRRIDSTERSYFRALKELQRNQGEPVPLPLESELASFRTMSADLTGPAVHDILPLSRGVVHEDPSVAPALGDRIPVAAAPPGAPLLRR